MPSDFALKMMNTMHRGLLTVSGGRIGWTAGSMPVLELTTVGRKTGESRSVLLTSPWQDGDTMALVASRGGDDRHPAWFLNLRDHPEVEVTVRGGTRTMNARVATPEERAELWPKITRRYRGYAGYQRKTDREIPVVLLEPVD